MQRIAKCQDTFSKRYNTYNLYHPNTASSDSFIDWEIEAHVPHTNGYEPLRIGKLETFKGGQYSDKEEIEEAASTRSPVAGRVLLFY